MDSGMNTMGPIMGPSITLIIVVSVVPTMVVLGIIIGIIVYIYCRRKARREKRRSKDLQSPFHADKTKDDMYTKNTTPSNYNLARDNSMKSRAKSVEFTFFDETGEIEEIVGYNDEDLKLHEGSNGDTTRFDHLRPSQIQGQLNMGLEDNGDGFETKTHLKPGDDVTTDGDYLRPMSTATDTSDNDYVIPDIPGDDVAYVKPDPPDHVEYVNDPKKKDYVNGAFLDSKNPDTGEEDDGEYVEHIEQYPRYDDDGYIGPNPASKSGTSRKESSEYAYAEFPKEISYSKDQHDYVNTPRSNVTM